MALLSAPGPAHADRQKVARITKLSDVGPLRTDLWVYSPANHKKMKVNVLTPANSSGPRSVVYMLDGADAGQDVSDWITKGRAGRFFADKNVTVVLPAGGRTPPAVPPEAGAGCAPIGWRCWFCDFCMSNQSCIIIS